MLVNYLLPALAAIGSVAAQAGTCTVSGSAATITNQADADKLNSCRTIKGSIKIDKKAAGSIDLSGPKEITGDLQVIDASNLETLSSSSITTIGGAFKLNNVIKLNSLQFTSLTSVQTLDWQTLTSLSATELGPLTEADEVTISDTVLQKLDSIDLTTTKKLSINNNKRLTVFTSKLGSLSDTLNIQANGIGFGLSVTLPNLVWIANMTIANVTELSVPSLKVVNGSARFDANFFESFSAPNLTHTESGDISFVGNGELTNLTFPLLKTIGGGLLIANNTKLEEIDAFKKLETVRGAVKLRGSFDSVDMPSLDTVNGAFDVSSTANIEKTCDALKKLAPASQGGNGKIEGKFTCTSENEKANEDTGTGTNGNGQIDGSDGTEEGDSGAAGVALNSALFGLVAIAAFASAL